MSGIIDVVGAIVLTAKKFRVDALNSYDLFALPFGIRCFHFWLTDGNNNEVWRCQMFTD